MRSRPQQLSRRVNSFLCSFANDLENRLLPNDLIVIRNQGVDHGEHVGIKKVMESQGNMHNMVEVQANLESRSLTSTPTRSLGLPYLQIDVHDAFDL
jgi:hypothetical protein